MLVDLLPQGCILNAVINEEIHPLGNGQFGDRLGKGSLITKGEVLAKAGNIISDVVLKVPIAREPKRTIRSTLGLAVSVSMMALRFSGVSPSVIADIFPASSCTVSEKQE